jgi:hypothetical protein
MLATPATPTMPEQRVASYAATETEGSNKTFNYFFKE